jgi:hypothetical protein
MSRTSAQSKRAAYEAEKAALDAVKAPASAYDRLDQAFFGSPKPSRSGWLAGHIRVIAPIAGVLVALGGAALFDGPERIKRTINGWALGTADVTKAKGDAANTAEAARYAAIREKAIAEKAEQDARLAKIQADAQGESPEEFDSRYQGTATQEPPSVPISKLTDAYNCVVSAEDAKKRIGKTLAIAVFGDNYRLSLLWESEAEPHNFFKTGDSYTWFSQINNKLQFGGITPNRESALWYVLDLSHAPNHQEGELSVIMLAKSAPNGTPITIENREQAVPTGIGHIGSCTRSDLAPHP